MPTEHFLKEYRLKAVFVFSFTLLLLFIRFMSNAMLSEIGRPPFVFPEREWLYQLFLKSGIPHFFTFNFIVGGLFDALLFFLPIIFMISLKRIYAIAFTWLLLLYFFTFNLAAGHHYHGMVAMLVITIPFWSKEENRFALLWEGARFYLLYIFGSAGLWKLWRGSVFYPDQLSHILKSQQLDLFLQQPDSFAAQIAHYLIVHPSLAHIVFMVTVLLQLSFLIGFFTKRFDSILLFLLILFVLANYCVMGIVSSEILILGITLLSYRQLIKIRRRLTVKTEMQPATT